MIASSIFRLELELTNTCNLECVLCSRQTYYNQSDFKIKKQVDFNKLLDYLDTLTNLQFVSLAGEYSEPTLYKDIFPLISYLNSRKIEIALFINTETHSDIFYKKIAIMFRDTKSKIILTICGSTQEMHEKYRVKSTLSKVIDRARMLNKLAPKNVIMTWIIFDYNLADYEANKSFTAEFDTRVFNSLPFAEYYKLEDQIQQGICLPKDVQKHYVLDSIPQGKCKSINNNFVYVDVDLNTYPCTIAKHNNFNFCDIQDTLRPECIECYSNNIKHLASNDIYTISESEDETSEEELRYES